MVEFRSNVQREAWQLLRAFAEEQPTFARRDFDRIGIGMEKAKNYLEAWRKLGLVEVVSQDRYGYTYRLTDAGKAEDAETVYRSPEERALWEQVKETLGARPELSVDVLVGIGPERKMALAYIRRWVERGWIYPHARIGGQPCYGIVSAQTSMPQPPEATPEGNMWRSMRILKDFMPTDIAAHSTAGGVEISLAKARAYCTSLLAAGYLVVKRKAIPGKREAIYRIANDTGPRPPRPARFNGVHDPNTGKFHPTGMGGRS